MTVIDAHCLVKRYGEFTAVNGIDVTVTAGECWGLLGPNGAGKTTFLRMVVGHIPPTTGTLTVLGHPIPRAAKTMRRRIGVVPQQDNLDPDFTVRENLRSYARFFGLWGVEMERYFDELLEFANLQNYGDSRITALSGGMQRRLSLIRALVNRPDLLILDEPTTGLDPQARQVVWQRLRSLKQRGMTLVLTTHYMEEAERLCDRITIMDHGKILDTAPPQTLLARHIESAVVEVHGPQLADWHARYGSLAQRHEQVGETGFYYVDDPTELVNALRHFEGVRYLQRAANLEDVFVKLTGRDLRED